MKRFFAKVGRFFWSRGFLAFVLGSVACILLLYVEEDWRGARAWAATKAEWEAKGETFDFSRLIPPPVPDDQNLAAIPLFKLEPVKNYDGPTYLTQVTLRHAMRDDLPSLEFPQLPSWPKGELPDMGKIKKTMVADYALAFRDARPPDDALAQFNAIYPFFNDFITVAATHSFFRINMDYAILPPAARPLGPITDPIKLSKILTLHGILALENNRPDLALQDLKTNYELVSGVKRDPSLVGGLVAIGVTAIGNGILYDGLAQHKWSDAQLGEIEQILKPMNFLADFQFAMRSEVVYSLGNFDYYERLSHRNDGDPLSLSLGLIWPDGWWDQNKRQSADALLRGVSLTDHKGHRVYVDRANEEEDEARRFDGHWTAYAPWNILYAMSTGPILNATLQFSHAQAWLDEARIACALERYHLVHGAYPDSLDALVPASIDAVPCDPINGRPYHYRVRPDGTFLLYSVGWNQKDDDGVAVFVLSDSTVPNDSPQKHGDWVWPTPQLNPQK